MVQIQTMQALPVTEKFPFEITVVPQENKDVPDSSKIGNPMNIKIKIRNKDEKMQRGIISVPKLNLARSNSKKIRHINSDQTIMSFDLLMEHETAKKSSKRNQKKIFQIFKPGTCLGSPSDEDEYSYAPSNLENINRLNAESSFERKRNDAFTLKKNPTVYTVESYSKSPITFLGKCKPGGCLDPPFGEDKYSYEPRNVRNTSTDSDINAATIESKNILLPPMLRMGRGSTQDSRKNDGRKVKKYSKNINDNELDLENCSTLNQNDSDLLITYPPALSLNELQTRSESVDKKKRRSEDKKLRKSQNELSEAFFKPQIDRRNRSIEKSESSLTKVTISERNSSVSKKSNGADNISLSKKSMPLRTSYTDKIKIHGYEVGTKYLEKHIFNKSDEDDDSGSRSALENKIDIKDSIRKHDIEAETKCQYSRDSLTYLNDKQNSEVSVNKKNIESKCIDKDLLSTVNKNIFRNTSYIVPLHEDYKRASCESISKKINTENATLSNDIETINLETQQQNMNEKSDKSASILLYNLHQKLEPLSNISISKITSNESSQSNPFNIVTKSTFKQDSGKISNTTNILETRITSIDAMSTAPSLTKRENEQVVTETVFGEDFSIRSNMINGSYEDSNDLRNKNSDITPKIQPPNKFEKDQVVAESTFNRSNTINGSFVYEDSNYPPKIDYDIITTTSSLSKREQDQVVPESAFNENSTNRTNVVKSLFLDEDSNDLPKEYIDIITKTPSLNIRENDQVVEELTFIKDSSNRSNTINGSFLDEDSNAPPNKDYDEMTTPSLDKCENDQVVEELTFIKDSSNRSNTINGSFLDEDSNAPPNIDYDKMTTPSLDKCENDQVAVESTLKEDISSNISKSINGSFLDKDSVGTLKNDINIMTTTPSFIKHENNQIITESVSTEDSDRFKTINREFLDEDSKTDIISLAPSLNKRENDQIFDKLKPPDDSFSVVNDSDAVSNRLVDNINKTEITSASKIDNDAKKTENQHFDIIHASKNASSESFKENQGNLSNIDSKLTPKEDLTKVSIITTKSLLAEALNQSLESNIKNITPTSLNKSEKQSQRTSSAALSIKTPSNTISRHSSYLEPNKDSVYEHSENENITEKNHSVRSFGSTNVALDSVVESTNENSDLSKTLKLQLTDNLDTHPDYEHDTTTKTNTENPTIKSDQTDHNMYSSILLKPNITYFSTSNRDSIVTSIVKDENHLKGISDDSKHSTKQGPSPTNSTSFTKMERSKDISQIIVAIKEGARRIDPTDLSNSGVPNVSLNLGFQTYTTDNNGMIINSFNPSLQPPHQPNEVITIVRNTINAHNGVVKVPMDSENDLLMRIIKKSTSPRQSTEYVKKSQEMVNVNKSSNTKLKKYLSSVYESNLVPVENIIRSLRLEIDSVAQRNVSIKEVRKRKNMKYTKTYVNNTKCNCCRL